jgi:hypothetical protein
MFGRFRKKKDLSLMFDEHNWQVAQISFEGNPLIIRINDSLKSFIGKTDHTLKIGFAIPLNHPNPGGMPLPEENQEINLIEDEIVEALKRQGSVVQALTITSGTFKEFVFYTKLDMDVKSVHENLQASISSHEVQCVAQIENNWETYKDFTGI